MGATALLSRPVQSSPRLVSPPKSAVDRIALALVIMGAIVLAAFTYFQFLDVARFRWGSMAHDRNAHYLLGLSLAVDIQQGDWRQLLSDFDGARTWPPLHGILLAIVLLLGGLDWRLAVFPSLAAWVGTIVFGFLTARRLAPRWGNLAGLVTVVFVIASPAHRVFATDVMLESLGACLTLAALYLYLVTKQHASPWGTRCLGLVLTALFFTKYNYWMLVVAALVVADVSYQPRERWQFVRQTMVAVDWRRWLQAQMRRPLNYLLVILLALCAWVLVGGGQSLIVFGKAISLHSPHNLVHLAYLVLFVRAVLWWRHGGRERLLQLPVRVRLLLLWHGLPIALWFLLPKRLGYWLWYIAANKGENPRHDWGEAVSYYASCCTEYYHSAPWSAVLAGALVVVGFVVARRFRPGARAVLIFLVLATAITVSHPNRKSRFVHSWIAAGWAIAGAGLVTLLPGQWARRLGQAAPIMTAAAVGGITLAHCPALLLPGRSPERGNDDYLAASTRDLTEYYLPRLADSRRTMTLATMDIRHLLRWSFLERYPHNDRLEVEIKGLGSNEEDDRRCFAQWLSATSCDTIVFLNVPPGSYFYEMTNHIEAYSERLPKLLESQKVFQLAERRYFSRYGCTVDIYRRASATISNRMSLKRTSIGPPEWICNAKMPRRGPIVSFMSTHGLPLMEVRMRLPTAITSYSFQSSGLTNASPDLSERTPRPFSS
jgi:hypothetical protein